MKVMLVEDALDTRRRLLQVLSQMPDIEITAATGGVAESIRMVRETRPDIILLDLHLSDGSGFDVLRDIKADSRATLVVMLTSFSSDLCRRRFAALGGDFFFDKSTQLGDAFALLGTLAHRSRKPAAHVRDVPR